jgi:hypothetical protein
MTSEIQGYVVEIDQNQRRGDNLELYRIKDYFYYDSNIKEYGYRDTVIPVEFILNREELTDEKIKSYIINEVFVMERLIDINKQTETWSFIKPIEENK